MVAHDVVVLHFVLKFLHKAGVESLRVTQVEALVSWEGDGEVMLLCEPKQDVQDGAAGSLVGLQEHDIGFGVTRSGSHQQLCGAPPESAGRQRMGKTASLVPYPIS